MPKTSVVRLFSLVLLALPISGCGQAAPGSTNFTDPNQATNRFIDIVRATKSDDIVQVSVTPEAIEVVVRQDDLDVYWTDVGGIHEVASRQARPAGLLQASSVDISDMIAGSQAEGVCESGVPAITTQATFSGEILTTHGCYSDSSEWLSVRKVILAGREVGEIDFFDAAGIATLLDESIELLPDGIITSIQVLNGSGSAPKTASVVGETRVLSNGSDCSPSFTRGQQLSAGTGWAGIDLYSCGTTTESTPFKATTVSPEQVADALTAGLKFLNCSVDDVTAWTLTREPWAANELVIHLETANESCFIDMSGQIIGQ